MIRKLLMSALLFLVGCAQPTSASFWHIQFDAEAAANVDEEQVVVELQNLAAKNDLPLTFSLEDGDAIVYVHDERISDKDDFLGYCNEGKPCDVWLSNGKLRMTTPYYVALITLHEIGHSYGLDHYDEVPNIMNTSFFFSMDTQQAMFLDWQREKIQEAIHD